MPGFPWIRSINVGGRGSRGVIWDGIVAGVAGTGFIDTNGDDGGEGSAEASPRRRP